MPEPLFEILSGTIDGVNDVFTFSAAYTPGTVALYLNGQLILDAGGNPWSESDPSTGEVTITEAECVPRPGDKLAGFALDTSDDPNLVELSPIEGVIDNRSGFAGELDDVGFAGIIATAGIVAELAEVDSIVGVIDDASLVGEIDCG